MPSLTVTDVSGLFVTDVPDSYLPANTFTQPTRVDPLHRMPGGGMERTATGNVPITIIREDGKPLAI